jgi:glycosyltransferase involved in cell wall biosynthesis
MTIGVDAGALCVRDDRLKVGVYRVIVRLLQELSALDTNNEYRLYSFAPIEDELMQTFSATMENIILKPAKGWFELRLPVSLYLHPVDLFLGVSQAVPLGFQKNIGFIYDLGFMHYPDAYPGSYHQLVRQTRQVVKRSEHIITISQSSKQDICTTYALPDEQVTVALPGVDERFSKDGDVFTGQKPYFLHVGSLKPGKNIPFLIRAFAEFLKQAKEEYALLIIGGDYWMDEEILRTIDACDMEDNVRLLGYIPDSVLPRYYRGAVAFVTASLSEGFCLPVIEAMVCACPVIAPNTASFPEIVPEEKLLLDPNDIHAYAQAMKEIATNTELQDIAIAKGLAKASDYSWKQFAQTVYALITKLLSNNE